MILWETTKIKKTIKRSKRYIYGMKTAIMLLAVAFKVTGDLGTMGCTYPNTGFNERDPVIKT